MARILEWMDVAELASNTVLQNFGWIIQGAAGVASGTVYKDIDNNGGLYAMQARDTQAVASSELFTSPTLSAAIPTFYARTHFRSHVSFARTNWRLLEWYNGSTLVGDLRIMSDGKLQLVVGGSQLAVSTSLLAINTWYTVEIRMTIGAAGTYEVRINNSSVGWIPEGTGNTAGGGQSAVNKLMFGQLSVQAGAPGTARLWDDLAFDTAEWVGESVITALSPTGAGTHTELTPTPAVANWQNVDEIPFNDLDYNQTIVPDKKDTYTHTQLPVAAQAVRCIYPIARVVRNGNDITNAFLIIRSGGTDHESAAKVVPTGSPTTIVNLWQNNPTTGVPWTVAELNASEVGIRFDA